jgi:hypothetical protein
MASKTPNLGLIKPARGEFEGSWDIPLNANADVLDGKMGDTITEVTNARGSASSLADRLTVALNADGSLKAVPEVTDARTSTVYSDQTSLDLRLEKGDREVYDARSGSTLLIDSLAFNADDDVHNSVLSAPNGFLSFTGANVKVDGSVTSVVANINGYRQVVRTLKSTTISGSAGTYYIYLQRSTTGEIILDRTGGGQNTGAVGIHSGDGKLRKLTDTTQNFNTIGVKPGDILEITSLSSTNAGQYVVDSVLSNTEVLVLGLFVTTQSSLNYKITNPLAPTLTFTATVPAKRFARVTDKIYIGRAVFDGTNVTSVTSYALKGRFEQFFSITLSSGNFAQTVSHNIGYFPSKVQFFASQNNDYSVVLEPLSDADMVSSTLQRSVISKYDDMTITVKNATNGIFYKGYDGTSQTTGYLLVVATR